MDTSFRRSYMKRMKARYRQAQSKKERSALIDETIRMTGLTRKYVIKLLCGLTVYRKHRGRRKTYSLEAHRTLVRIWAKTGLKCSLYLHAQIKEVIQDYIEEVKLIPQHIVDELVKMSPSTIERVLKRHRAGVRRYNKRSGHAAFRSQIPSGPGAPEPKFEPGHLNLDTVSLCGGDAHGDHFWILNVTDVATQMTWSCPCWNCGAEATIQALEHILAQIPFKVLSIHTDNGPEFINHHLKKFLEENYPDVKWTRSRPYRKNDNCRVEQKNYSLIRAFFGDLRFEDYTQLKDLIALCDDWNLLNNFTEPCRKLIFKEFDPGTRTYTKNYDAPRTPWQRLNEIIPQPPHEHINSIRLRKSCEDRLTHLYTSQKRPARR